MAIGKSLKRPQVKICGLTDAAEAKACARLGADAIGLGVAVEYLSALGMENVRRHEVELLRYAFEKLSRIPNLTIYGPMDLDVRGGVISFNLADIHPHDMASILDEEGDVVKVKLTDPKDIKWNFCLMIGKCPYKLSFVNTGVPHVIHFVEDLDQVDVKNMGSHIRYHDEFSPEGTNADFVKVIDKHNIKVRTYERGVEDETLACGTGAVASAVISAEVEKMSSPVTVQTRSGERIKVYFDMIKGNFRNVYLEGMAKLVYEGVIDNV